MLGRAGRTALPETCSSSGRVLAPLVYHRRPSSRAKPSRRVARFTAFDSSRQGTVQATTQEADLPPEKPSSKDAWQRLQLLLRQQEVAVAEEDYQAAARLRDEVRAQVSCLPPIQQYLHRQVAILRTGQTMEKIQAIKAMVEAGDDVVVPELAKCLADPELADLTYEAMWSLFMRNPDPEINGLMVEGMSLMNNPIMYEKALEVFNDMVMRAPEFPEAYNKRATVLYTMKRFEDSIADCKRVLRMQPWHFGAASGMGLCYLMLSRESEAAEAFELALSIHPGMGDIARVLAELRKRITKGTKGAMGTGEEGGEAREGGPTPA